MTHPQNARDKLHSRQHSISARRRDVHRFRCLCGHYDRHDSAQRGRAVKNGHVEAKMYEFFLNMLFERPLLMQ